jgi:hypothetical protein
VGLQLLHALEAERGGERASAWREPLARMLDRILQSANPDGLLYDDIRASDLKPNSQGLSDNWGYVYGAVYTHYLVTGDERYREPVRRVLRSLPRYRGYDWERGSHDGYADAIESAIYLVNREPVPEALDRCWRYLDLAPDDRAFRTYILIAIGALEARSGVRDRWRRHFDAAKAIIDDLGAIIIIAIFYTEQIAFNYLFFAALVLIALMFLNRFRVYRFWPYAILGFILWIYSSLKPNK